MSGPAAMDQALLYRMRVMHRRRVAPLYRFVYRIFYLLLDVDALDALAARLRWFSHNRFNLFSLHDRDHGRGEIGGLRRWAETICREGGVELAGGRIRLLTQPRMLGWVFNPVSFWYCEHADGRLRAIIAEVRNTFGEKHSYLLTAASCGASAGAELPYEVQLDKRKCFHVSPLLDLEAHYHFRFSEPAARIRVLIHETRGDAPVLDATMAGESVSVTDRLLLRQLAAMPVQAIKVVVAIHWQALKIWLRGARFYKKPEPPKAEVS